MQLLVCERLFATLSSWHAMFFRPRTWRMSHRILLSSFDMLPKTTAPRKAQTRSVSGMHQ